MNTHTDKTQEHDNQSVANDRSQSQNQSSATFQFVDNRSSTVAQQKLQEVASNSPQVQQATQLQGIADHHATQQPQPVQKKDADTKAASSPLPQVVQRVNTIADNPNDPTNLAAPGTGEGFLQDSGGAINELVKFGSLSNDCGTSMSGMIMPNDDD